MRTISMNGVVRSVLSQKRLPIHYYSRFLKYVSDGYREVRFDSLQIINTVRLTIDANGNAEIPEDCIDASTIRCGVQVGQFVRPLVKRESINRLSNIDTATGEVIPYTSPESTADEVAQYNVNWSAVHYDDTGENTGGYYGLGAGEETDTYAVIEERNQIQFHQSIVNATPVARYLSDGSFVNAASEIPPFAQKTIEDYADWMYKDHSKNFGLGDANAAKDKFDDSHKRLRSRKNDFTPEQLERIMQRRRKASIK